MARERTEDINQRSPSPPSLLIAAHCATIRRKGKRLEITELTAIFDDVTRELATENLRSISYLHSLNQVIKALSSIQLSTLPTICSHYFFLLVRNTIRDLLRNFCQFKRLADYEIYALRNTSSFLHHLIEDLPEVSKILYWITDVTFLDALADCLTRIEKLSKKSRNRPVIKHITRLLNMFAIIQERLPIEFHRALFVRLLQPTTDCLTSLKYVELFENFQSDSKSITEIQKLYLLKCPYFLTTYSGPHFETILEEMLELMLPRYVTILDRHIQTIKQWNRPIMRAIHNLIITIVFAEGYFSPYTHTESFRSLINHLLIILSEPTLIEQIHPHSNNMETLLIDATLIVFNVLVYESSALDYIKQCKPSKIFRKLTTASYETIALNAYMMLAYTIDQEEIQASPEDLPQLLLTIVNLLRKTMTNPEQMNLDRSVLQLLETLKGLAQHEQICNEILKQNLLTFFIDYQAKLHGLPKQVLLECLWQLSFNEQIAQQLRNHPHFISSLENIPKPMEDSVPSNRLRRSSSFGSRRNNISTVSMDVANYGIQKVADGILWKLVKESQCREKMEKQMRTISTNEQKKYQYDIVISSCYSDRNMVQKIQQFLGNEGYNVWLERNHNYEHPMKIVADAIENSEFFMMCLSDSYKRDNRCQAQAEYASVCKKLLLPLIVHSGYKPDGWLTPFITNHNLIDFETSKFDTASQLLLEEIKRRQSKKNVPGFINAVTVGSNIIRSPSAFRTTSDEPSTSREHSTFSEVTMTSSSFNSPLSSAAVDKQNSMSKPSISSMPITNNSINSSTINKQAYNFTHSGLYSSTPILNHATASMDTYREYSQQQLISDSIPVRMSTLDTYEQKPSTPYAFTLSKPISVASIVSKIENKEQQNSLRPMARPHTPHSFTPDSSITAQIERQQLLSNIHSENIVSKDRTSLNSTLIDGQQLRTSTQPISETHASVSNRQIPSNVVNKQQSPGLVNSDTQSFASASFSFASNTDADLQSQLTTIGSIPKSELQHFNLSNVSVSIEKRQEESQQTTNVVTRSSETNTILSTIPQQPSNIIPRSSTYGVPISPASITVDGKLQHQTRPYVTSAISKSSSESFHETDNTDKQLHEKMNVDSISHTSMTINAPPDSPVSVQSNIKETALNSLPPIAPIISNKQRRRHTSVHSIPKSSAALCSDIENQEPSSSSGCNSNSITYVPPVKNSATNLAQYSSSQRNSREELTLLEKYINRKTDNSIYRTLSLDIWRNNDVLDFLCDTKLHTLMPLCESMSGKALLRLFRMCQKKPTRLYDQLNEELRTRFKGLTLPMGTYTQFLIEMDALMSSTPNVLPSTSDPTAKVVERVILMPRAIQRGQVSSTPSALSSVSSERSNAVPIVDNASGTKMPQCRHIFEQAVYRPASNIGRPYNFIIESVEEPTVLLDQVYRYGNQLLVLDATTHQHREVNNYR